MTAPKVSVIVTCFNLGAYLDAAIDSVLAQTFEEFEILIVDDGSTDESTRRLLADYRRPRTRVIRTENRGLSAARNTGAFGTSGEYLCMLDADDILAPTLLEKSVRVLDADPSVTFVSHWLRTFGDETWEWTPARCDLPTLLDHNTVNGAALMRRSAFEAVGGFDESMVDGCEDWDLWITLVERGYVGTILPDVLFNYRRRPDSMSRLMMNSEGYLKQFEFLVRKHASSYGVHLDSLIVWRDAELADLHAHVHDLEIEYRNWLEPRLLKSRDDMQSIDRRAARRDAETALKSRADEAAAAALEAGHRVDRAETERDHWRRQADDAEGQRLRATDRAEELGRELRLARERAEELGRELQLARERAEGLGRELRLAREDAEGLGRELQLTRDHGLAVGRELQLARERVQELDREVQTAREHAGELGRDLEAVRERAEAVQVVAERAHADLAAMRASMSWRVTALGRRLYDAVRGTQRKAQSP